ncbi:ComF family protein [Aquipuribacter sp. MA13-6]|uniref:ComF family protein n=1 Tax=Aquipuribacter sp. MA13-6 TaxID=3440839 RepID=UPI003EEBDCC6
MTTQGATPRRRGRTWGGLLVPLSCPGCGAVDEVVCPACRDRLLRGPLLRRPLADGTTVVASAAWRGPARRLVVAAKESGRRDVGVVLARAVARAVVEVAWGPGTGPHDPPLLLVAPPVRLVSVLRRGARPTPDLAEDAARLLRAAGAQVQAVQLLRHTRAVADQGGLDREERADNLAGAFETSSRRIGSAGVRRSSAVVVVDDVVTTGATVQAVAAALREGGLKVLGAGVVASA